MRKTANQLKAARSDQSSCVDKKHPSRHYVSAGASPVAYMPNLSTLSPIYPLPTSPNSAASSTVFDDAIGDLFTRYLPPFFDFLENFQYEKALQIREEEEETQWKNWEAFKVMLKLGASCESTYHLMKYLEAELVQTDTIEQMYRKSGAGDRNGNVNGSCPGRDGDENGYEMDRMLMTDIATCGDMSYYIELLKQGAEFFSLRGPMIQIYRGLALSSVPRDYNSMLKRMESLLLCVNKFNHPLLETMKQSAIEELNTVHAAIQCEIRVAEYDFTRSIVALHRFKVQLRSWSDHIDAVSDYPLFEGSGIDFGAGVDGEGLLLDESDENYGITSDSMYSSTSYQSYSSHARDHLRNTSLGNDSYNVISGVPGGASLSLAESLASYSGERFANVSRVPYDVADEMAKLEKYQSGVPFNSSSPALSEAHSSFRRLLSHSNVLRRSVGLTSALPIRRELVQKPGDPYIGLGGENSSLPTNALEQAILGGEASSTGRSGGGAGASFGTRQGISNGGGIVGGSTNQVAAEMMASSIKNQERDDGFALPVFQWSKRFYRSLVAKFTLYFHHWLEPFEKKTDCLALELSRFIKTPLGISYLQLMNVLLSRSSHCEESQMRVMLILETQALENKGAHYYKKGYRCPNSSNALYTSTDQEKQDKQERQRSTEVPYQLVTLTSPALAVVYLLPHLPEAEGHRLQMGDDDLWTQTTLCLCGSIVRKMKNRTISLSFGAFVAGQQYFAIPKALRPVFMHSERRQMTAYHISRVDDAMYLVLLAEGVKKLSEKVAQDFMQTVTENLQHAGVFAPRIMVSTA
ncbi:unnamed protein product [Peronospora destructor]|uniref:RGS domain-containing protein n=1 Tax=Peronospora destructor TaxID=86335 RepID=A0AAV0UWF6_9STRA|nr:unnamed protein product [Peronospora destructor]